MSVSLSATVAIPGIPRFYKSNVQKTNKSVSIIPNFLKEPILNDSNKSGLSDVEINLLGTKREEGKSILLESTFIYGVDLSLWTASGTFNPNSSPTSYGHCSILNPSRYLPPPFPYPPVRSQFNPRGYLIQNSRVSPNQIIGNTLDLIYDPTAQQLSQGGGTVSIGSLTTLTQKYIYPIIYHNSKGSCVTLEGWLEPYVTPLWGTFPFDACTNQTNTRPFDATLTFETVKTYRYEPGKAMTFTMGVRADVTGGIGNLNGVTVSSRASWGCRNDTDIYRFVVEGNGNFYVERVTPYAETSVRVLRKDFIDPLDGGGASGLNIDFSKITMYSIEFSWYGAVGAHFYAYVPYGDGEAKWVKIAAILASNRYNRPVLSSPNMRLFTELYIPMGCSKLQSMGLYGSSVYMDGNYRDTLKYYTASTARKPIEKVPKTFITLESPNFLDGDPSRPKNNSNDFPKELNGLTTVDSQIDIYEAASGGSTDIITAYYQRGVEFELAFGLQSNVNNGTTNSIIVSLANEEQKIDAMRRLVGSALTFSRKTTLKYAVRPDAAPCTTGGPYPAGTFDGPYYYGGECNRTWQGFGIQGNTYALPGALWFTSSVITSVSSSRNNPRIQLTLSEPVRNLFYAYTSANASNISLRNSVARTYNAGFNPITGYPSIPIGSPIYTPGDAIQFLIYPEFDSTRSFIVTRKPIKSGSISFDTDLMCEPDVSVAGSFGIITESDYKQLQDINFNFFTQNPTTSAQTVSASPKTAFHSRSQIHWTTERVLAYSYIWAPNYYGFPQQAPFYTNGLWNYSEIPETRIPGFASNLYVTAAGSYLYGTPKQKAATLFDQKTFTKNIDIRDHEFYFYGVEAQAVPGVDNINFTYIRVRLRHQDLFSLEDGVLVNNIYNLKLLLYGHNGQMYQAMSERQISSAKNNWSDSNAKMYSVTLGPGTSYSMTDAQLETNGSLYYTVAFPKNSFSAINAFRSSPNLKFRFKSVFFRNIEYRSPLSTNHQERNAGLWYGTFFIPTLEPVHLFIFLGSAHLGSTYTKDLYNAAVNLPRPLVTNIQLLNGRDKNNVYVSESPAIDSYNVFLQTNLPSMDAGELKDLPLVNFNFEKIEGINTRVDSSTCQVLNTKNKTRKFTFFTNKNIPFKYDLSNIYNPSCSVFTPLQTSSLNKDFKRLYITSRKLQNESFGNPWFFSQTNTIYTANSPSPVPLIPFTIRNPFGTDYDAALFDILTSFSSNPVTYLQKKLGSPALSDKYYIWSVYATPLSSSRSDVPSQPATRYVIFEHKTANTNIYNSALGNETIYVIFDIEKDLIAFSNTGQVGFQNNWRNAYNNTQRNTFVISGNMFGMDSNINAFPASPSTRAGINGYANLANKNDGKFVVAAHIETVNGPRREWPSILGTPPPGESNPPPWKRLSTCVYYKNNHTDNVIHIGTSARTYSNVGRISLYGFQEEVINADSTIENLSAWYPSPYIAQPVTGNATFNLMVGEQL